MQLLPLLACLRQPAKSNKITKRSSGRKKGNETELVKITSDIVLHPGSTANLNLKTSRGYVTYKETNSQRLRSNPWRDPHTKKKMSNADNHPS